MFNFYNIVKVFVIGACASVIITGASLFYMVPKIMGEVDSVKRQSLIQYQRNSSAYKEADTGIGNRIDRSFNDIRSVSQALTGVRASINESEITLSSKIDEDNAKINSTIWDLLQNNDSLSNNLTNVDEGLSVVLDSLVELNTEVSNLRLRQDELALIQAGVLPINVEIINTLTSNLESSGECPTNVTNRADHLPRLRRYMEAAPSSDRGLHNVLVKYDITEDGSTFFKEVGSATASDSMLDAVQKYVDALVFEKSNNYFANCEMIVKLNIR